MTTEEIAQALLEAGACQDCGCPVTTIEDARAHAILDGAACEAWNDGEGAGMLTVLLDDGQYTLVALADDADEFPDDADDTAGVPEPRLNTDAALALLCAELADVFAWEDRTPLHAVLHVRNAVGNLRADLAVSARKVEGLRGALLAAERVVSAHGEAHDLNLIREALQSFGS